MQEILGAISRSAEFRYPAARVSHAVAVDAVRGRLLTWHIPYLIGAM
jgi:hypothetical protein